MPAWPLPRLELLPRTPERRVSSLLAASDHPRRWRCSTCHRQVPLHARRLLPQGLRAARRGLRRRRRRLRAALDGRGGRRAAGAPRAAANSDRAAAAKQGSGGVTVRLLPAPHTPSSNRAEARAAADLRHRWTVPVRRRSSRGWAGCSRHQAAAASSSARTTPPTTCRSRGVLCPSPRRARTSGPRWTPMRHAPRRPPPPLQHAAARPREAAGAARRSTGRRAAAAARVGQGAVAGDRYGQGAVARLKMLIQPARGS